MSDQTNIARIGILTVSDRASQGVYDGIVYNPGAHTHYSYALHDAISSVTTPVVEVHISSILAREEFRHHSVLSAKAAGIIVGCGVGGYDLALAHLASTSH